MNEKELFMKSTISFSAALVTLVMSSFSNFTSANAGTPSTVTLDFSACAQQSQRVDLPFGGTWIEVIGKSGTECILRYSPSLPVGQPNSNTTLCAVPQSEGPISFPEGGTSVDFSTISSHCAQVQI
jgi:hypothetical protein